MVTKDNTEIEEMIKKFVKSKGANKKLFFNGSYRRELFVIDNNFTIEDVKNKIENAVKSLEENNNSSLLLGLKIEEQKTLQYQIHL